MKETYAEQKSNPFDWNNALRNLIRRKTDIDSDYHDTLTYLSGSWVTCACGNQCAIIPRDFDGEPFDRTLVNLGVDFDAYIIDKEWKAAKEVLKNIEVRSSELIARLCKEKLDKLERDRAELSKLSARIKEQKRELELLGFI